MCTWKVFISSGQGIIRFINRLRSNNFRFECVILPANIILLMCGKMQTNCPNKLLYQAGVLVSLRSLNLGFHNWGKLRQVTCVVISHFEWKSCSWKKIQALNILACNIGIMRRFIKLQDINTRCYSQYFLSPDFLRLYFWKKFYNKKLFKLNFWEIEIQSWILYWAWMLCYPISII